MCRPTARRACKRAGASATWDESGCTHDAPLSQFQKISDADPESRSCPAQPSDACSYLCSYPCSYPFEKCVRPSRGLASCPWMVLRLLEKDNYKDNCRDNYRHRSAAAIGTSRAVSFVEFFLELQLRLSASGPGAADRLIQGDQRRHCGRAPNRQLVLGAQQRALGV